MHKSDNKVLNKVYTATNHEELMDAYKDWATDYDKDTVDRFGYVAHLSSARALDEHLDDKDAHILDAGCGTGLVAEKLVEMGYKNIDALDYSEEMLEEAEKKGLYKNYIQADLSRDLDIDKNRYDAVVCTGTFTYGHIDAEGFDRLIRITKPEGINCFTIRDGAYQEYGYREKMVELEQQKEWELLEMRNETYFTKESVQCKLCTYKVFAS
ncbi:MAG: class I SAM-dependent methyltransferase [Desulfobacteraceae bacterium]